MVLSGTTISKRGLIVGGIASSMRDGSYDLTIKDFVTAEGKIVDEYLLPAQGIVKVISGEEVRLPTDIIGYVLVKTKLCNEGVLALNIGIVDPGFEGPLQSALINFGKTDIRLYAGDVFSRISFHSLDVPRSGPSLAPLSREAVRREVKLQTDRSLPSTFLDIPKTAEKAAEKMLEGYKTTMLKWLPIAVLLIGITTFMLNFGNMWLLYSYMKPQDTLRAESLWREADERMKKLEAENISLRQALAKPVTTPVIPQIAAKTKSAARGKP
jgi:dUTPase